MLFSQSAGSQYACVSGLNCKVSMHALCTILCFISMGCLAAAGLYACTNQARHDDQCLRSTWQWQTCSLLRRPSKPKCNVRTFLLQSCSSYAVPQLQSLIIRVASAAGEGWDALAECNKWTNATPEQYVLGELAQAPTPEAEPPQPLLPGVNYVIPGSEPEVQGWVPYIRVAVYCNVDHQDATVWYSMTACAILYLVLTYLLLWFKLKSYRQRAYTSVQVGLVYNTLQVRRMTYRD